MADSTEAVWNSRTLSLKNDRSRTKILKISELGLLEMTRKRARESLVQTLCNICFYCEGKGQNKSPRTICNDIIRSVQKISKKNYLDQKIITIEMNPFVYDIFFEEEASFLGHTKKEYGLEVKLLKKHELHQEKYNILIN